jgi:hypothetical protein
MVMRLQLYAFSLSATAPEPHRISRRRLGAIGSQVLVAQSTPVTRTMLQQKDLEGAEGRELLMYRADFVPGGCSGETLSP